ncbi:MAG: DUF445 family protein [Spirochaetales bacterium]|nr:DUF445 family protein [Spirochaetales bacterium]
MTTEFLTQILSWTLPPVLGAIIGYVTNYLAIKMLFRPLTEKRIFNIRIPLTPGIIPKQRHVLAESIGNMVSKQLLTFDTFKIHFDTPAVQDGLKTHISRLTQSLLTKRLSLLEADKIELFLDFINNFIFKTLNRLFHSDKVTGKIKTLIRDIISAFLEKNAYDLLASIKLKNIISSYVLPFITGPKIKAWLLNEISQWTKRHLKKNTPLLEIIPADFIDDLFKSFTLFLPELIQALFNWLRTEETKTTLEQQGRELIKNVFKKLNLFQQFFVSVAQYDKTLTAKMPEIVDDTLNSFESAAKDPANQIHFIESAQKAIHSWLTKGVFDIFFNEAIDIDEKLKGIVNKLFGILESPEAEKFVLAQAESFMEKNRDKTLKELLALQAGIKEEDIIVFVQQYIIALLSKKETIEGISRTLSNLAASLISGLEEQPVSELLGLDDKIKAGIDGFLYEKLMSIIESKLPDLVESLNVKDLVVKKINGLNVADVEKLLLMVIAQHLKWINIFGALLGAVIGFIQVIVNIFMK